MDDLITFDLKQQHPKWVEDAFLKSLDDIQNSNHSLKKNYTGKELKLDKMASFNVVLDEKQKDVICFSGLQIDSWKYPIARVSSRHFFSDKYTSKFLRKRINWKICVVEQIKTGLSLGYDKLFFSTELMDDRMFKLQCSNSTKAINTILPNVEILCLPDNYDTTGRPSWQRIGQIIVDNKHWIFPLEKRT